MIIGTPRHVLVPNVKFLEPNSQSDCVSSMSSRPSYDGTWKEGMAASHVCPKARSIRFSKRSRSACRPPAYRSKQSCPLGEGFKTCHREEPEPIRIPREVTRGDFRRRSQQDRRQRSRHSGGTNQTHSDHMANTNNWLESTFRGSKAFVLDSRHNRRIDSLLSILVTSLFPMYEVWEESVARRSKGLIEAAGRGDVYWERGVFRHEPSDQQDVWTISMEEE